MERNKYYAVLKGNISGIFLDFEEFSKSIKECDDAEFEIFYDIYEAVKYLREEKKTDVFSKDDNSKKEDNSKREDKGGLDRKKINTEDNYKKDSMYLSEKKDKNLYIDKNDHDFGTYEAYVDGSFDSNSKTYGSGVVILKDSQVIEKISSKGSNEDYISMRNVAGEIEGAMIAMKYCLENNIDEIKIYYDYLGIEKWCLGEWKTNKNGTKEYKKFFDEVSEKVKISFEKVKAHSGNKYNEMADLLAKKAVE